MNTVRATLREVSEIISRGWVQNSNAGGKSPFADDATEFCVFGALCRVIGITKDEKDREALEKYRKECLGYLHAAAKARGFPSAIHMNDDPEMTKEKMVEMILEASTKAHEDSIKKDQPRS